MRELDWKQMVLFRSWEGNGLETGNVETLTDEIGRESRQQESLSSSASPESSLQPGIAERSKFFM